jgi:hypothetical protein
MELMAYRAARVWIEESQRKSLNLPTPLQYGIALKITSAPSIFSLWSFLRYIISKNRTLPRFVSFLGVTIVMQILLGSLATVADTWLHLTATSVPWETITPLSSNSSFNSRVLLDNCTSGDLMYYNESGTQSCTVPLNVPIVPLSPLSQTGGFAGGETSGLFGVAEGLSTVNNASGSNTVRQIDDIAFITPVQLQNDIDFNATSYGIRSQCKAISRVCGFNYTTASPSSPYDCGNLYPGVSNPGSTGYGFSSIWFNLTIVSPEGMRIALGTGINPYHVFIQATIDTPPRETLDPEFVPQQQGTHAILLWCEIEVLDVTFSIVSGQPKILETKQSSNMTTYAFSSILGSSAQFPTVAQPLWLAAEMDAISGNSTIFSGLFANDMSRIGVGLGAGVLNKSPTLTEALHTSTLVSRLPKAPLFSLVVSFFLYTLVSIYLVLSTLFTSKGTSVNSNETEIVKNRLADPLGIVQESFGDASLVTQITAAKMFHDDSDGVLRVRQPEEYGSGESMLLELCVQDTNETGREASVTLLQA